MGVKAQDGEDVGYFVAVMEGGGALVRALERIQE